MSSGSSGRERRFMLGERILLKVGSALVAFAFGAVAGRFLNMLILYFSGIDKSTRFCLMRCGACGKKLGLRQAVPIISWLLMKGQYCACKTALAGRLPMIESIMGGFALVFVLKFGLSFTTLELFIFVATLVTIAFIDLDTWIIPIPLSLFLTLTGLMFALIASHHHGRFDLMLQFWPRLLGGLFGLLFLFALLVVLTWSLRRLGFLHHDHFAMGFGDPLLLAGIGTYVGILGLPQVVLLASIQGLGAYVLGARPLKKASAELNIPEQAIVFGPFLSLGGIEVALYQAMTVEYGQQFAIFFGT